MVIGPISLLWVDSGSFFIFALLLSFLFYSIPTTYVLKEKAQDTTPFFTELVQGVSFTFRNPLLLALTSISFFWNAGLGLFLVALPFYCERVLKVGPVGMGLLLSVNSIGVLISSLIFGPLRPRYLGRITCILLIMQALCYGLLALIPPFCLVPLMI